MVLRVSVCMFHLRDCQKLLYEIIDKNPYTQSSSPPQVDLDHDILPNHSISSLRNSNQFHTINIHNISNDVGTF